MAVRSRVAGCPGAGFLPSPCSHQTPDLSPQFHSSLCAQLKASGWEHSEQFRLSSQGAVFAPGGAGVGNASKWGCCAVRLLQSHQSTSHWSAVLLVTLSGSQSCFLAALGAVDISFNSLYPGRRVMEPLCGDNLGFLAGDDSQPGACPVVEHHLNSLLRAQLVSSCS